MEKIHMWDIISLLGIPYPSSGQSSYYVQCPCCDENPRKKHLNINLKKEVFRCPRCGASGGIFDLYSRMKRLYHTEVWYGRFLLYPLEGGESDVLIAVIIIVTTNHFFIHSMPSWHVAYIAVKHAVKRYVFSLLWWHAKRRHGNGPQTGLSRTG